MKNTTKEQPSKSRSNPRSIASWVKRLTILQVIVGFGCLLLVSSGSAYYLHKVNQDQTAPISGESLTSDYLKKDNDFKKIDKPKDDAPTDRANDATQNRSQPTQPSNVDNSANDEWLRRHEEQMRKMAIEDAKRQKCEDNNSAAEDKYSTAIDRARAAYDEVMAQWDSVKHLPYYQRHPYDQYAADAKSKHNAISVPAYEEYSRMVNSLKSQGCQITQLYPDYSR